MGWHQTDDGEILSSDIGPLKARDGQCVGKILNEIWICSKFARNQLL
jgi:hypothetical protein